MKKGFTLIELLGVIVILAMLLLISSFAITRITKGAKSDINWAEDKVIFEAADEYMALHMLEVSNGNCIIIQISQLQSDNLLGTIKKYKPSAQVKVCDPKSYKTAYEIVGG